MERQAKASVSQEAAIVGIKQTGAQFPSLRQEDMLKFLHVFFCPSGSS
jgi:hypothetical protein